jgi:transcription elongation factor GreB
LPPDQKLMTKPGYLALHKELEQLVNVERPKVLQGIQDAAAEGDRSENAEYIYGRKRLREMDKRIQYINRLFDGVRVIDPTELKGDRVAFGATVLVEDSEGKKHRWTIIGEGEIGVIGETISWKSPVGKALHGKRVGDFVDVSRPIGDTTFEILGLEFTYGGQ